MHGGDRQIAVRRIIDRLETFKRHLLDLIVASDRGVPRAAGLPATPRATVDHTVPAGAQGIGYGVRR